MGLNGKVLGSIALGFFITTVLAGALGYIFLYISGKNSRIAELQDQVINCRVEIVKQNQKLREQANELNKFNQKSSAYDLSIADKYKAMGNGTSKCDQTFLQALINRSFDE